jgi:uncharacterized protein YbjQ (UPF0145 family)
MTRPYASSLSVPGFLTLSQTGFRPIGQVQGASVYRVGWQRAPRISLKRSLEPRYLGTGFMGSGRLYMPRGSETVLQFMNEGMWVERETQTEAYREVRRLALDRLKEAARNAGAVGVVDIHLRRRRFPPVKGGVEFSAIGTAIAGEPEEDVFLATLSGEEIRKLLAAGYRPIGIVGGVSVVYVIAGLRTKRTRFRLGRRGLFNQEYGDYTDALRAAQSHALGRLRIEANHVGAGGVLGIKLTHLHHEPGRFSGDRKHDLTIHVDALGTAVAPTVPKVVPLSEYALDLSTR